jgi:hypothetical protein
VFHVKIINITIKNQILVLTALAIRSMIRNLNRAPVLDRLRFGTGIRA